MYNINELLSKKQDEEKCDTTIPQLRKENHSNSLLTYKLSNSHVFNTCQYVLSKIV